MQQHPGWPWCCVLQPAFVLALLATGCFTVTTARAGDATGPSGDAANAGPGFAATPSDLARGDRPPGRRAVVRDDDNNLRKAGGTAYRQARILGKRNQGDVVYEQERQGNWSRVITRTGLSGWVHSACLGYGGQQDAGQQQAICPGELPRHFPMDSGGGRQAAISLIDRPTREGGVTSLVLMPGRRPGRGATGIRFRADTTIGRKKTAASAGRQEASGARGGITLPSRSGRGRPDSVDRDFLRVFFLEIQA